MRSNCNQCGVHPVEIKGRRNGSVKYGKRCDSCRKKPYTISKKETCEICGFIPVNRVQLDVDHIDGNNLNNDESNLQTICANCHRLKTYLNSDWKDKESIELESLQLVIDLNQ